MAETPSVEASAGAKLREPLASVRRTVRRATAKRLQ